MEPLGVLVFSVFMISSFLQVLIESIGRILDPAHEAPHIPYIVLAVMGTTIVVKAAVWLSCRAIKSASVEALQQDAENDVRRWHTDWLPPITFPSGSTGTNSA
jgi:divalent metal cation (Fe/Co/Zn/Cd) transporter